MIFNNGYYHAMDQNYHTNEPVNMDIERPLYEMASSKLGPKEIGTGTHPMQNTLQSLLGKIRSGAGKIEFEFIGQGKTSSQQPGPESFGSKERRDMRDLVEINQIRTSTHAALHGESLAGLDQGRGGTPGFKGEAQQKVLKEIEKAIHFAAEATRGGAVVFHTGEWQRPLIEIREKNGEKQFKAHSEEHKDATYSFVDTRTGDIVGTVARDVNFYEPEFKRKWVNGREYFVDVNGGLISLDETDPDKLFNRVPEWNKENTNFNTVKRDWAYFEKRAQDYNRDHPENAGTTKEMTPQKMFFTMQKEKQILELKGNSLFHGRSYDDLNFQKEKLEKALDFYKKLDKNIPEDEKWKIMVKRGVQGMDQGVTSAEQEHPLLYIERHLKEVRDNMRHIHESSAAADARAKEQKDLLENMKPVEEFGITKTMDTLAKAAMTAMKYTEKNKDKLAEPIFIAPENFMPQLYGSHPDEIRTIIVKSREEMAKRLVKEGYSSAEAKEKAKTHIKATVDIGHLNLWRQHFERKEGESMEEKEKRFEKWILDKTQKLAEDGIIGHIHLTDNFGYDDEHITPGQGNVPMKEFIKRMEEAGVNDFIAEAGSFNGETVMHDTWALMNGPVYGTGRGPGFSSFREGHLGYTAPPNYIVGAYSPSNEWKLWSEVPLE
jgi:hypothetical protein